MKYPDAWSYTRLQCYESCAFQYKCRHIDKLDEPKSEQMWRGIKVHNELAKFLDGTERMCPPSAGSFTDLMHELKGMNPVVEQKWAFDRRWRPTGYFQKNVRVRMTCDVSMIYDDNTAEVIDHKTGKYRPDDQDAYIDQLTLFAGGLVKLMPQVQEVTARLWYVDTGDEEIMEFTKREALDGLSDLEERADKMLEVRRFPPNPSWKCRYCHFRRENGGPCEH